MRPFDPWASTAPLSFAVNDMLVSVQEGESFEIWRHGGPIAVITPIPKLTDLTVPSLGLAAALGCALRDDVTASRKVVAELERTYPDFDWKNAMTDRGDR